MKSFTIKYWPVGVFLVMALIATGGQMYAITANSRDIVIIKKLKLDKRVAIVITDIKNIKDTLNEIKVDQREQRKLMLEIYREVKN